MRATAAVCEVCAAVSLHRLLLLRSVSGGGSSQGFSPPEPASSTAPLGPGQASDAMAFAPATAVGQTRLSTRTATGPGETEGTSRLSTASLVWGWGWPGPAAPQQPAARTPPRPALPRAPAGAHGARPRLRRSERSAPGGTTTCAASGRRGNPRAPFLRGLRAVPTLHHHLPGTPGPPRPAPVPRAATATTTLALDACHRLIPACKNQRRVLLSPFYG